MWAQRHQVVHDLARERLSCSALCGTPNTICTIHRAETTPHSDPPYSPHLNSAADLPHLSTQKNTNPDQPLLLPKPHMILLLRSHPHQTNPHPLDPLTCRRRRFLSLDVPSPSPKSNKQAFNDRRCIAGIGKSGSDSGEATADQLLVLSAEDTTACCHGFRCGLSMGCNGGQPGSAWGWFTKTGVVSGGDYADIGTGTTCKVDSRAIVVA